jgi:hypothetical protein
MQATVTAAAIASPVPVEMQATVAAGRISFEEAPVEEAPSEYTSSVESTHDREERMEEVIVDDFVLSPSLPADILEQEYMHHLSPVEGPVGPEYYLVPNRNTALAHFTHDV